MLLGTPSKGAAGIPEEEEGRDEFARGMPTGRWARDEDGRLRKLSGPGQAAGAYDDPPGVSSID
jgi:hypothetical protein